MLDVLERSQANKGAAGYASSSPGVGLILPMAHHKTALQRRHHNTTKGRRLDFRRSRRGPTIFVVATSITVHLSEEELRALERATEEGGFADAADALRAGIPRLARSVVERRDIAEAYRRAYADSPQDAQLDGAGAELLARIVEQESSPS